MALNYRNKQTNRKTNKTNHIPDSCTTKLQTIHKTCPNGQRQQLPNLPYPLTTLKQIKNVFALSISSPVHTIDLLLLLLAVVYTGHKLTKPFGDNKTMVDNYITPSTNQ